MSESSRSPAAARATPSVDMLKPSVCEILVCQLSDRLVAFRREDADRIVPMAELACPPGLPSVLEGILDLAGTAIPVLRLDRLFHLSTQRVGLYSMLVILRVPGDRRIGVMVDRVSELLSIPEDAFLTVDKKDSFNACAEATVTLNADIVHLLSPARMLLEKEHAALLEFEIVAQRRLQEWGTDRA